MSPSVEKLAEILGTPCATFAGYSALATRTITAEQPNDARKVNAALGLAGEAGELVDEACKGLAVHAGSVADMVKKETFHAVPADVYKIRLEVGDVLWYLNQLCYAYGLTLGECATANIEKLRKRYPDGFVKGGGVRE